MDFVLGQRIIYPAYEDEPEDKGTVVEIGENYIVIEWEDGSHAVWRDD